MVASLAMFSFIPNSNILAYLGSRRWSCSLAGSVVEYEKLMVPQFGV